MNEVKKKKLKKILTWTVIIIPFMIVLLHLIRLLCPIQFTIDTINIYIYGTLVVCELLLVLLLIWLMKYTKKEVLNILIRVIITAFLVYIFPTVGFFLIIIAGVRRDDTEIFINKSNKNIKIEEMRYDAGATDSGGAGKIVEVNYFFPLLRYVSEIDTNKIDKKKWERVIFDPYYFLKK